MRKILLVVVVALVAISFTTMAVAAVTAGQPAAKKSGRVDPKLERGAKNTVLGWTEIPKEITSTTKNHNALVGVTFGTVKGVFNAFARTLSGIVDVVTFPWGAREKPVIQPSIVK